MPPRQNPGASPPLGAVRKLVDLALAKGLEELEVSWGEIRIRIRRQTVPPASQGRPGAAAATPAPMSAEAIGSGEVQLVTIEAPIVGTFYHAPSPEAQPYVREGDLIKVGQILCIIEAMKLMNEIESKVAGRVVKILVENAQPVEYGQPLFLVEPA
ncbi:MAG: acetyl-CoA carboxylase biotin carboxyl carrier protein [Candidatus Rokubacteria bacterium]|nr:acetyl-CoA carboxylase biotin carboxyl carrier protein [Candidatus Rokubacteria bacterium]